MNSIILKTKTQDLHDSVEKVMYSSLLFSDQYTTEHYQNFLLKSFHYLVAVTQQSTLYWPEFSTLLNQKKEALYTDLTHLGIPFDLNTKDTIGAIDKYYNLGLIYIVLGAMLGNKMILKKLKEYESFNNSPFNYLSTHQEQLPAIWKDFQSKINALDASNLDEVIKGARDGYQLYGA